MSKLATALIALALFCSPAAAKKAVIPAKPPVATCLSPEAFKKTAPAQLQFKRALDGDEFKNFKKNISEMLNASLPNDADTILLFESAGSMIFVVFVKGCVDGFGRVDADHLAKLLRDDESI